MKKLILFLILSSSLSYSKDYSLDELLMSAVKSSKYSLMEENYSKISEKEVLDLISYYYPQFNIDAQATYQSDIFELPLKFPGVSLPTLRQDQYNVSLNVSQVIWDGGAISKNTRLSEISALTNSENSKAKLRNVIEAVANMYFAARKIDAIINSTTTAINTLESNKSQIRSLVENGVLVRGDIDAIEIQIQARKQNLESLQYDLRNIMGNLNTYCEIDDITGLIHNNIDESQLQSLKINRNEIYALGKLQEINLVKSEMKHTETMPKFQAFAKVGYGIPNQLNMFEQEWSDFYIVGIKMSWKPFSWFSGARNAEIAELQNRNLEADKLELIRQINTQLSNEKTELNKAESLLMQDITILELQQRIIKDKYNQLIGGTATVNEYLSELNSLQQYEINMQIHRIMLENAKSNILIKSGNYQGVLK
ncbi:MAG: TolC family protein [Desulfobulbaceae bacterium]|nr:TolC family protein [Desulfobulbaceae bacterium]